MSTKDSKQSGENVAELKPCDLETLRLGYYSALRREHDPDGNFLRWSAVGQPSEWPTLAESVERLVGLGLLEPDRKSSSLLETPMKLTRRGQSVYKQFLAALESGKLRSALQNNS